MKDSPNFLYINIILLIKSPSNFPIYRRDLPIFLHINLGVVLKIIHVYYLQFGWPFDIYDFKES